MARALRYFGSPLLGSTTSTTSCRTSITSHFSHFGHCKKSHSCLLSPGAAIRNFLPFRVTRLSCTRYKVCTYYCTEGRNGPLHEKGRGGGIFSRNSEPESHYSSQCRQKHTNCKTIPPSTRHFMPKLTLRGAFDRDKIYYTK